MSKAEQRVKKIRDTYIGATAKKVLLVEGVDDVSAFQLWLGRKAPEWESTWAVVDAGNKKMALQIAPLAPDWLVLVDRDEWSTQQLTANQATNANLFVLPRFCIESYLVDPSELWSALPPQQTQKVPGGLADVEALIYASLPSWRRHAALWHVINPLWSGLRALGFKEGLLKTKNIPNDTELDKTLKEWDAFIDVDRITDEFKARLAQMNVQALPDFLHQSLYAKNFYPEVVHPALDSLLGAKSLDGRRSALLKTIPLPDDLETLWQRMELV